jgi:hypothetical protein
MPLSGWINVGFKISLLLVPLRLHVFEDEGITQRIGLFLFCIGLASNFGVGIGLSDRVSAKRRAEMRHSSAATILFAIEA